MNISFTKEELRTLYSEIGMLVEACDECVEEGEPRPDDALIRKIYVKIARALLRQETAV